MGRTRRRFYAAVCGPIPSVPIHKTDADGRPIESIQATRGENVSSAGDSLSDTFAPSAYVRCTLNDYHKTRRNWIRAYHLVPESGEGTAGAN